MKTETQNWTPRKPVFPPAPELEGGPMQHWRKANLNHLADRIIKTLERKWFSHCQARRAPEVNPMEHVRKCLWESRLEMIESIWK